MVHHEFTVQFQAFFAAVGTASERMVGRVSVLQFDRVGSGRWCRSGGGSKIGAVVVTQLRGRGDCALAWVLRRCSDVPDAARIYRRAAGLTPESTWRRRITFREHRLDQGKHEWIAHLTSGQAETRFGYREIWKRVPF